MLMTKKCTYSLGQLMNDSQQYNTTLPPIPHMQK